MTFKSNFKYISTTLFVFCLPLILFATFLFSSYYEINELQWSESISKSAVFFGLICLVTLPGFLLHFNYYIQDKGKELIFKPTLFELREQSQVYKIYYKDIQKVERHSLVWSRKNPWNDYGFMNVILKNGTTIKFTCLLNDPLSSEKHFQNNNIDIEEVEDIYTWVT